jgi:hypothetical protein
MQTPYTNRNLGVANFLFADDARNPPLGRCYSPRQFQMTA